MKPLDGSSDRVLPTLDFRCDGSEPQDCRKCLVLGKVMEMGVPSEPLGNAIAMAKAYEGEEPRWDAFVDRLTDTCDRADMRIYLKAVCPSRLLAAVESEHASITHQMALLERSAELVCMMKEALTYVRATVPTDFVGASATVTFDREGLTAVDEAVAAARYALRLVEVDVYDHSCTSAPSDVRDAKDDSRQVHESRTGGSPW